MKQRDYFSKKNFHKENIHENSTKGKITKKIEQIIIERN